MATDRGRTAGKKEFKCSLILEWNFLQTHTEAQMNTARFKQFKAWNFCSWDSVLGHHSDARAHIERWGCPNASSEKNWTSCAWANGWQMNKAMHAIWAAVLVWVSIHTHANKDVSMTSEGSTLTLINFLNPLQRNFVWTYSTSSLCDI